MTDTADIYAVSTDGDIIEFKIDLSLQKLVVNKH